MKAKIIVPIIIIIVVVAAVGILYTTTPGLAPSKKPLKVGMLFLGALADGGWNATAYEGLLRAKEKWGLDILFAEDVPFPELEAYLRDYAAKGCDLIIAHSGPYNDPALKVAKEYPNTKFMITDGTTPNGSNVAIYRIRSSDADSVLKAQP
jgi:basic membrane protein A